MLGWGRHWEPMGLGEGSGCDSWVSEVQEFEWGIQRDPINIQKHIKIDQYNSA